tara:strand:- start:775 stop:987 length:213 start_codon:yes stop_codon:yes gene_type:complete
MEYLTQIIEQIEKCGFTDKLGHPIENNIAFIALKEHSKCDGMAIHHDCKSNSNNYICDECVDRIYSTSQG